MQVWLKILLAVVYLKTNGKNKVCNAQVLLNLLLSFNVNVEEVSFVLILVSYVRGLFLHQSAMKLTIIREAVVCAGRGLRQVNNP